MVTITVRLGRLEAWSLGDDGTDDTGGGSFCAEEMRERDRTVKGDAIETSFQLQCHLSVAVGVL